MLFDALSARSFALTNRIVMAPMTRSRAVEVNTPNALMAEYYSQRAAAGLIITEGTAPSPNGLGYVVDHSAMGAPSVPADFKLKLRAGFQGCSFCLAGLIATQRNAHSSTSVETSSPSGDRCSPTRISWRVCVKTPRSTSRIPQRSILRGRRATPITRLSQPEGSDPSR
jgi:2,4-dienoyl-CoA reductase-like NADH-dependent reductase (Old Yellow Enzyme family)